MTVARYLQDSVCESSLEDLSVINLLLDGPSSYQAVDGHLATLSHAPRALPRLKQKTATDFSLDGEHASATRGKDTQPCTLAETKKIYSGTSAAMYPGSTKG